IDLEPKSVRPGPAVDFEVAARNQVLKRPFGGGREAGAIAHGGGAEVLFHPDRQVWRGNGVVEMTEREQQAPVVRRDGSAGRLARLAQAIGGLSSLSHGGRGGLSGGR